MRRRRPSRGFTLVETLVSLAIATMAVTGFYQALSQGLFMERRADVQAEQMLVATQVLDRVGIDLPLRIGLQDSGTIQGLEWSLSVTERGTPDMTLGPVQSGELAFIYVTVESPRPDGSPLVLRGIRYRQTPL
ncbi:PulJ/GspJ family protein [Loktanella sp. Alg231-35]|uniref:PulJ/GspJ family protein n=1 Tax=Loktanella sp. Alg231-35 TaxID=1922220 RepID=UPI000D55C9F6|nr:prepilin-type N-terminal cleavage/methylation domain-containing protein [Loktanella sp. Alg231-35]